MNVPSKKQIKKLNELGYAGIKPESVDEAELLLDCILEDGHEVARVEHYLLHERENYNLGRNESRRDFYQRLGELFTSKAIKGWRIKLKGKETSENLIYDGAFLPYSVARRHPKLEKLLFLETQRPLKSRPKKGMAILCIGKLIELQKIRFCRSCCTEKTLGEFERDQDWFCKPCKEIHDRIWTKYEYRHVIGLLDGRDFCLYCGKKIHKQDERSEDGEYIKSYIELDHMDPKARGGVDNVNVVDFFGEYDLGGMLPKEVEYENTVYCCTECNRRKRDKLFLEWVATLEPKYQELSRRVYAEKHFGRTPEEFVPYKWTEKY